MPDVAASLAAELRVIVGGLDLDLLNCVDRGVEHIGLMLHLLAGQSVEEVLIVLGADAVHHEGADPTGASA